MSGATQDDVNRSTWRKLSAQRDLARGEEFSDPGERAALEHVAHDVRGKPILDLGVGTGRTIPLLSPLTDDYRAVDYLPAMVEASRRAHPDVTIAVGDARSLAEYPASHFGMVTFSYNGIDAVSAADRPLVFRAVKRVLAPGGVFFFSTLNIDGPSFRERPWKLRFWGAPRPFSYARQIVRQVAAAPISMMNWLDVRQNGERGDGWAVAPLSAHRFGVLAHYTTLARQMGELRAEGFADDPAVWGSKSGARVALGDDVAKVDWFHIVATKA